ncbi:MAG: type II toxin-antitoxin system VapC family toxin [Halobaculum sp.]
MTREIDDPLYIDTNALVALFDADDERHQTAKEVFTGIRRGELSYGPLYTSRFVIAETATTVLGNVGHDEAVEAVRTVRNSTSITVLSADPAAFDRTVSRFVAYDDHRISFVDHTNGVLADEHDIDHVFAFDDDFATLGLTQVPVDTGEV